MQTRERLRTRPLARWQAALAVGAAALALLTSCGGGAHTGHDAPGQPASTPAPASVQTLYTCGMHPEVIAEEPGNCPKCGMKLVPMDPDRAQMILEARGQRVGAGARPPQERKILYWRSPHDPTYVRSEPGKDSMGMELVPVYEDEVAGGPTITIDPVTEQNMALRYDVVRVGPLEKTVRTVGTVDYDERSLATVTTKVDGWVERIYVEETGAQVHAGDPLFDVYAPALYSAQEEFLVALRDVRRAAGDVAREAAQRRLDSARDRLRFFDISDAQIDELERSGTIRKTMTLHAQLTGIVTQRHVTKGQMLKAGEPAYQIADLANVWVIGKVYESDLPFIKLGQEALMTLDYLPGRTYSGRLTYVYPYLEPGTREVPVRMEFHNPGYALKPGMFATIRIRARLAEAAVLVPAEAVIDTGERRVVFVADPQGPGRFVPRRIETGPRSDRDELQVLRGLAPGERVVVSGQFLLDSESRLREVTLKMLHPGMTTTTAVLEATPEATPPAGPLRYVCPMPEHAGVPYDEPGVCPRCGMRLVPVRGDVPAADPIDHYTCPMPEHAAVHADAPGRCPLCGMTLIPVPVSDVMRTAPARTTDRATTAAADATAQPTLYTCPMASHAHIVRDAPGECPECGMKLVPTSTVPHGAQAEAQWKAEHRHD